MTPETRSIIEAVAIHNGTTVEVLRSKQSPVKYFAARSHVYKVLREHRKLSLAQIGIIMGGRCHTTILHGLRPERRLRDLEKLKRFTKGASVDA